METPTPILSEANMAVTKVRVLAREVQYDGRGRLRGETFDADERWANAKVLLKQVEAVPGRPFRNSEVPRPVAKDHPAKPDKPAREAGRVAKDVEPEAHAPAGQAQGDPIEPISTGRKGYQTRRLRADTE